jgi:hypothetical protein
MSARLKLGGSLAFDCRLTDPTGPGFEYSTVFALCSHSVRSTVNIVSHYL